MTDIQQDGGSVLGKQWDWKPPVVGNGKQTSFFFFLILKYYFGLYTSSEMPGAQRWTVAYVTSRVSPYDSYSSGSPWIRKSECTGLNSKNRNSKV